MKIVLLGYSGSGKSTLAAKLAQHYNLPLFYFDKIQFLPGWVINSCEEKDRLTKEFLDTHNEWVMDGNYSRFYLERRVEEADKIIIMTFNRWNCLYRIIKRNIKYKNKTRPSMTEGCNEKLDWEFLKWILWEGRTKEDQKRYKMIQEKYPEKVVRIYNQKQLDKFEQDLKLM